MLFSIFIANCVRNIDNPLIHNCYDELLFGVFMIFWQGYCEP